MMVHISYAGVGGAAARRGPARRVSLAPEAPFLGMSKIGHMAPGRMLTIDYRVWTSKRVSSALSAGRGVMSLGPPL
jgi:hypothetical protein